MKTISRLRYFIYLSILIVGCTTGKNALQKGDYRASLSKAINRLQNSPTNAEAKQVLAMAYDLALKKHLSRIEEARYSGKQFRWEDIIYEYQEINQMSEEINDCPSCLTVVPMPQKFVAELAESKANAAGARYDAGINLLNEGAKIAARKAYNHFERVQQLYPGYKDVQRKINEAYNAAVLKVIVQPVLINSSYYQLSSLYFQEKVNEFIYNYQKNKFVKFYDEQQAVKQKIIPDQVIRLRFDDFMVGQTYVKERVEKLKKDSVVIGETRATGPIYGTVKATLSVFNKSVTSSGILDLAVIDCSNNKIVRQKKLSGTYIWEDRWASYKGDDRALTKQQLALSKKREILPPAPEALFVEFTKPIYSQLVNEINGFYNGY